MAEGGEAAAVAGLDPEAPTALRPEDGEGAAEGEASGELPEVERAEPLEGTVLLDGARASRTLRPKRPSCVPTRRL